MDTQSPTTKDAVNESQQQNPVNQSDLLKNEHRKHTIRTILLSISLVLISVVGFFSAWLIASNIMPFVDDLMNRTTGNGEAVMTVGEETIYSNEELTEEKIEQLARESVILQGGQALELITLSEQIYDTAFLDKDAREKAIETVKESFKSAVKSGSILSVYFGYFTQNEEEYTSYMSSARAILSSTRNKLLNGDLNISQAIDILANNETIITFQDDRNNTPGMNFNTISGSPITYDLTFDEAIHTLDHGDISEIYEITDFVANNENRVIVGYNIAVIEPYDSLRAQDAFESWTASLLYAIDYETLE